MSAALAALIDRSHREREDWRYTNVEKLMGALKAAPQAVAKIANSELPSFTSDASQRQEIIFVNGVLSPRVTNTQKWSPMVVAGNLESGYRLTFADQSCLIAAPIELIFVNEGTDVAIKLDIDVGANSSLTIVEHHIARGDAIGSRIVETSIELGSQAKLVHKKIAHAMGSVARFTRTQVRLQEGAYYRHFSLMKDAHLSRDETDVMLDGPMAQCSFHGVMLLRDNEHADVQIRAHHNAAHTTSRQLYKAIVKDRAHGVFQGRIKVAKNAQKIDGQQLCRALLLSDQAEMDAKPELEIYADDVSCSHGCAIGDIDPDAMFYLRSRGLSEAAARGLLLRAFVDEVLDELQVEETRTYVRGLTERWADDQG
jgi:Fe-S cluster assembly protein SufD